MADERKVEYMALAELMTRLHPDNPKNHDLGAIIESYKNHGYVASGILDDRTGLFLAGHGRVLALASMKRQKMEAPDGIRNGGDDWFVPVQVGYSSQNDVQAKAYIVADNRLTTLGGWDENALATLLQELANSDEIGIEASGYSGDDLDQLLADLGMAEEPTPDPGAQVDRAAELQEKWLVQRGDVWKIPSANGDLIHRIMCGDSTSAEDVEMLMGGVKADAVVTDPPYGITQAKFDYEINLSIFWDIVYTVSKVKCPFVITASMPFTAFLAMSNLSNFLYSWVWVKNVGSDFLNAKKRPMKEHEDILVFCREIPIYNLIKIERMDKERAKYPHKAKSTGVDEVYGHYDFPQRFADSIDTRCPSSVLKFNRETGSHPTQKPSTLLDYLIRIYTHADFVVLDVYCGSGTTIVACEQTGRVGYGMEIAPEYVSVCLERLSDMGLTPERK